MMSLRSILTQLMKKRSDLEDTTRVHLTISTEDFRGGVRAVIRSRNILIDNSFSTQLKEQYDKFVFLGARTALLKTAKIYGINGPVIYLKGNTGFRMSEMVYVGEQKLVGEVIALDKDMTTVQVYEETTGLRPGEEVIASGSPVSVTLAPGILNNIFDGIERPLENIAESSGGAFITRGVSVDSLDRTKNGRHILL